MLDEKDWHANDLPIHPKGIEGSQDQGYVQATGVSQRQAGKQLLNDAFVHKAWNGNSSYGIVSLNY